MKALHSCNPASSHFLDVAYLIPLIDTYSLHKRALESELPLVKCTLTKNSMHPSKQGAGLACKFDYVWLHTLSIQACMCIPQLCTRCTHSAEKCLAHFFRHFAFCYMKNTTVLKTGHQVLRKQSTSR